MHGWQCLRSHRKPECFRPAVVLEPFQNESFLGWVESQVIRFVCLPPWLQQAVPICFISGNLGGALRTVNHKLQAVILLSEKPTLISDDGDAVIL